MGDKQVEELLAEVEHLSAELEGVMAENHRLKSDKAAMHEVRRKLEALRAEFVELKADRDALHEALKDGEEDNPMPAIFYRNSVNDLTIECLKGELSSLRQAETAYTAKIAELQKKLRTWEMIAERDHGKPAGSFSELVRELEPEVTGKKVDVNGRFDEENQVEYLGHAYEMTDGTWRCLANYRGMLCRVQVAITQKEDDECPK